MMETKDDGLMTLGEVAKRLRVASSSLYRMHKREHLPMFKIGRDWRCKHNDLEEWIEEKAKYSCSKSSAS